MTIFRLFAATVWLHLDQAKVLVFFMISMFQCVQSVTLTSIYTSEDTCESAGGDVYGQCHALQLHILEVTGKEKEHSSYRERENVCVCTTAHMMLQTPSVS